MALKENYKDDILDTSQNVKRKYQMENNGDGTVSFTDVTEYTQQGDSFGSGDINATNSKVNTIDSAVTALDANLDGFKFYSTGTELIALQSDDSYYTDNDGKYIIADSPTGQQMLEDYPSTYKALASVEDLRGEVGADSAIPFSKKKDLSIAVNGTYGSNWSNRTIYTNNSGQTETLVINRHKDNSNSFTGAYVYVDGNGVAQHQLHYVGKVSLDNGKSITMTTENSATGVYNIVKMVDA